MKNAAERYADYLHSPEWRELRLYVLERDGWACRLCGSTRRLEVHHRWYPEPMRRDGPWNCTTLCRRCHRRYHRLLALDWRLAAAAALVGLVVGLLLG